MMSLTEIEEKCIYRDYDYDDCNKYYTCSKNGIRHEECKACQDCEKFATKTKPTLEDIKNGNNNTFVKLIEQLIKETNELLILEKEGGKFVPRLDKFCAIESIIGELNVKYTNKNTDLFIYDINRK